MTKYRAEWSGSYPCLCHGEWTLFKDDVEITIPIPFQGSPANTYNVYSEWRFDDDWSEDWDDYEDGELCDDWCLANHDYLSMIAPKEDWPDIFAAFQANDWRHNSCGGCI